MTAADFRFGFRIVGGAWETRRLVDAGAALAGYAACDDRAEIHQEAYLSAFQFGEGFRWHLVESGSTAGYSGPCWSPWLWFDLDSDELHYAHKDAGALAVFLVEGYAVDPGELLIFFSGSKGFHVGLSTRLWSPAPSADFHKVCRRLAEHVAELAAVTIDAGVYDRVRAFRAPNSKHPKTGLHKRRFTFDELTGLSLDSIVELSREPARFDLPTPTTASDQATADWQAAVEQVTREAEAKAARRVASNGTPTLNRSTLDFIRHGANQGDRHRLLYSAAANLGEFACPPALAVALLEESALDSGLAPKDVRRQIECGLAAVPSSLPMESTHQDAPELMRKPQDGSTVKEPPQRDTSDSGGLGGQTCQQVTPPTGSTPAPDLQAALARLWGATPAPKAGAPSGSGEDRPQAPTLGTEAGRAVLPPDPPPLTPLPPGAVGSGNLDKPCKCGSTEFAEIPLTEGRTRRDCRKCGRFAGWGRWYDQGGPTL